MPNRNPIPNLLQQLAYWQAGLEAPNLDPVLREASRESVNQTLNLLRREVASQQCDPDFDAWLLANGYGDFAYLDDVPFGSRRDEQAAS